MKKRLSIFLVISILAILLIPNAVVYAGTPTTTSNQQGVSVPVVLDGKYYQPAEFNNIQQQLNARGVYLGFIMDNGTLYAYSNIKDLLNKYSMHLDSFNETTDQNTQQTGNQITPLTITAGWAYNWININQGGNCSAIQEGVWTSPGCNFSGQFLNSISCIYYPSGGSTYWNGYVLFDQFNQSGNIFLLPKGHSPYNLPSNWNDKAESFEFSHT